MSVFAGRRRAVPSLPRTIWNRPGCVVPSSIVYCRSWNVPNYVQRIISPIRNPKSPTRFMMNALLAAVLADLRST